MQKKFRKNLTQSCSEIVENVGIDVTVVDDILDPDTPDSIFPNNWILFMKC
jgi:hypothetical protein